MALKPKVVAALPLAAAAIVAAELVRAAVRRDLPSFTNQDPTGSFGDPSAPRLRIVALGDSSITAPGVEDLDDVWIRCISQELASRYRVELISLAVGGSKARDVIEGQLTEAERLAPDIACVSVGANDALRGTRLGRFRRELDEIVSRLEAAGAAVVLYGMGDLGSIPRLPPTLSRMATRRSEEFDRVCRRVAVAHPRTVKVHTRGRIITAFRDDPSLFAGDLFHACGRGHALFAEEAMPAFAAAAEMAMQESPVSGRQSQ
jgi:lysophospholipase L1-like esterase